MRVKRVNRYYCDFCKKSGGSKWHLERHEERCTLNPNRTCGVCGLLEETQPRLEALVAMLPSPEGFLVYDEEHDCHNYDPTLEAASNDVLKGLREAANDCPACILAAIRQSGIPVPIVSGFNWTKEMKTVWDEVNNDSYE